MNREWAREMSKKEESGPSGRKVMKCMSLDQLLRMFVRERRNREMTGLEQHGWHSVAGFDAQNQSIREQREVCCLVHQRARLVADNLDMRTTANMSFDGFDAKNFPWNPQIIADRRQMGDTMPSVEQDCNWNAPHRCAERVLDAGSRDRGGTPLPHLRDRTCCGCMYPSNLKWTRLGRPKYRGSPPTHHRYRDSGKTRERRIADARERRRSDRAPDFASEIEITDKANEMWEGVWGFIQPQHCAL
ncbi:hypothetical protein B0H19DRAFT_1070175 [Mycena capillaripes]|nr:hypothetical protein B0H19DRAFT_1070175 [Mycena capillaripes]